MGVKRSLVFMNWQQRLKDVQFKLEARSMQVGGEIIVLSFHVYAYALCTVY
jgi:hypothetical protein